LNKQLRTSEKAGSTTDILGGDITLAVKDRPQIWSDCHNPLTETI